MTSRPDGSESTSAISGDARSALVDAVMSKTGFDLIEASFVVALELGEIDGDIVYDDPPMSPEDRRRLGLDPVREEDGVA